MKLFLSVKIKRDNTRDKRRFCTSIQTVKRTVSDCTNAQMHVFHPLVSKSGHYVYGWCVVKSRGDHLIPMSFCCELSLKWCKKYRLWKDFEFYTFTLKSTVNKINVKKQNIYTDKANRSTLSDKKTLYITNNILTIPQRNFIHEIFYQKGKYTW